MRKSLFLVVLSFLNPGLLLAQDPPKAQIHLWMDGFGGSDGAVLYPQYGWSIQTDAGQFTGYGFVERAPHEPLFTNHLVVYTPDRQKIFSIQTETGGRMAEFEPVPGKIIPPASFFQIGPRVNIHEAIPVIKKEISYLFVTILPKFEGIRTNNFLISGGTNKFSVTDNVQVSVEAYRRFFAGPDYAEYWFLVHPKVMNPFSLGVFVLHDGSLISTGFGGRLSVF